MKLTDFEVLMSCFIDEVVEIKSKDINAEIECPEFKQKVRELWLALFGGRE